MLARGKRPQKSTFDIARDELFSHIHRCGVLKATDEQQREWMDDTMEFMAERYPELEPRELKDLEELGMRFCQPVIGRAPQHSAVSSSEDENAA